MSLKKSLSYKYYIPLYYLYGKDYPDQLYLTNKIIPSDKDMNSLLEIIVEHGLGSKTVEKLSSVSPGDNNELSEYITESGSVDYDKNIISDILLIMTGMAFTIFILLFFQRFESIFEKLKVRNIKNTLRGK